MGIKAPYPPKVPYDKQKFRFCIRGSYHGSDDLPIVPAHGASSLKYPCGFVGLGFGLRV